MSIIVEDRRTGQVRLIDTTPPTFKPKPKPLIKPDQSSVLKESFRRNRNVFSIGGYTSDGCNKGEKAAMGKIIGKTRLELPHPCWKAISKRKHQWKRQLRGYASARILNETGRCVYLDVTC